MPVVVTGADSPLGTLVLERLVGQGLDLRATVDNPALVRTWVDRGVRTAVSELLDTERFAAVLEGAHTVLHLRGAGDGSLGGRCLDGLDDVVAALPDSGVARVVTLAPPGAAAELARLESAEVDTVVLHVGVVAAALPVAWRCAPIHPDDLADALVAADRLRNLHGHLRVWAVGPSAVDGRRSLLRRASAYDLVGDLGAGLREVLGVQPRRLAGGR